MNLCKDCIHFRDDSCWHPFNMVDTPDYVRGKTPRKDQFWATAQYAREAGKCKPDGIFFEARPPAIPISILRAAGEPDAPV